MTEPQVWTVIGVLTAGLFGLLTLMSTMFARIIRVEIGGVYTRIDGLQNELTIRFDSVNRRIDGLDRDIHFLMSRDVEK